MRSSCVICKLPFEPTADRFWVCEACANKADAYHEAHKHIPFVDVEPGYDEDYPLPAAAPEFDEEAAIEAFWSR